MNRRHFIFSSATLLCTGCVTETLQNAVNYQRYTENVDNILLSVDGKKLVFIGPEYHYIFDMPEDFSTVLNSSLRGKLTARFSEFYVDLKANVSGEVDLSFRNMNDEEVRQAQAMEFYKKLSHFRFSGIRYSAKNFKAPQNITPLQESYTVRIKEAKPPSVGGTAAMLLLTPLTIAADGAFVLLGVPLFVISAPFLGFLGLGRLQ